MLTSNRRRASGDSRTAPTRNAACSAAVIRSAIQALGVAGLFVYADGLAEPTALQILQGLGWVLLANAAVAALALGIGSFTGSRALTLTAVIGWETVASQLIMREITHPGFLLDVALGGLAPLRLVPAHVGEATAVGVVLLWALVPLCAGAWRTVRQDA